MMNLFVSARSVLCIRSKGIYKMERKLFLRWYNCNQHEHIWDDDIKVNLNERMCEDGYRIQLVQDRVQ
jgi:hypothetical protein